MSKEQARTLWAVTGCRCTFEIMVWILLLSTAALLSKKDSVRDAEKQLLVCPKENTYLCKHSRFCTQMYIAVMSQTANPIS